MKRGDVVLVAGGVYGRKPRPAVVVQAIASERFESLTVCPTTTTETESDEIRMRLEPSERTNLLERSWIMIDKIETIPRRRLGRRIGSLSADEMRGVDQRLSLFLGLGLAAAG